MMLEDCPASTIAASGYNGLRVLTKIPYENAL
jgi:hypothetical protein